MRGFYKSPGIEPGSEYNVEVIPNYPVRNTTVINTMPCITISKEDSSLEIENVKFKLQNDDEIEYYILDVIYEERHTYFYYLKIKPQSSITIKYSFDDIKYYDLYIDVHPNVPSVYYDLNRADALTYTTEVSVQGVSIDVAYINVTSDKINGNKIVLDPENVSLTEALTMRNNIVVSLEKPENIIGYFILEIKNIPFNGYFLLNSLLI